VGADRYLFLAMFKEDWRLQKAFVGSIGSAFFPVMIFLFSLVLSITSPMLLKNVSMDRILLILHLMGFLYGMGVGALAQVGEQVMNRRLGQVNMLLGLPALHPLIFRRVMALFFYKDAVFYIFYSILPLVGGIAVAAPFTDISLSSVGVLGITVFLAFMIGMSLSFLISAVATRSRPAAGLLAFSIVGLALLVNPMEVLEAGQLLWPLGFWTDRSLIMLGGSVIVALGLSVAAILTMKERVTVPEERHHSVLLRTEDKFAFTGDRKVLVAKEFLELRRSGTLGPVLTGFLGPLLAIYIMVWIFQSALGFDLTFNVLFFGGMVGFLGVMTYSWLTLVEPNEFLNVQPVGMHQVIGAKLVLYFIFTYSVSIVYLVIIAVMQEETALLPVAVLTALATTTYVAAITGYLTGLKTNTMLFDARVLSRFTGALIPPLIIIMIASFLTEKAPTAALAIVVLISLVLILVARHLLSRMGERWRTEPFGM